VTAPDWQQSRDRRVYVAEAPGGGLLMVTRLGRDRWVPAIVRAGRTLWRGQPYPTRDAAQAAAEAQAGSP